MTKLNSATLVGIESVPVTIEARYDAKALPRFEIVGLPEHSVREARVRIRAAVHEMGMELPLGHTIVSLTPAGMKGAQFDLPIALAMLAASEAIPAAKLDSTLVVGELTLDGTLRPVRGVIAHIRSGWERGVRRFIIPAQDQALVEAVGSVISSGIELEIFTAGTLDHVVRFLRDEAPLPKASLLSSPTLDEPTFREHRPDFTELRGYSEVVTDLIVSAVAHRNNILLSGPPGAGKTSLARRIVGLLGEPTDDERLLIAKVASVSGLGLPAYGRPFRAPHHTASDIAIFGGGDPVRPGEMTLAHGGVLFLDELPEFRRSILAQLAVTWKRGITEIARVRSRVTMPAKPMLIASMNPCPCGYAGDPNRLCSCTPERIAAYQARLPKEVRELFPTYIVVPPLRARDLKGDPLPSTAEMRKRVEEYRRNFL